ncbi:unnamed protein product [Microthlaspi erraticum]|uniref:DUF1685 domain-containing protein n=1 Tax=Microthlaspi erraticum TaxID=1685480 RepID=A0A6D2KU18_9BRAS|nr:unnamed protein product [Microthlaspi erraticum]
MVEEEELLKLFEQNWSERPIFKKSKDLLNLNREKIQEEEAVKKSPVSFLVERAMSDETMMTSSSKTSLFVSSSDDLFLSPRSVLNVKSSPVKLQTILSGKEVNEFSTAERERVLSKKSEKEEERRKKQRNVRTRRGKSMSDLEYEELKGFMDLGFVFSEEDQQDSNLVSILPGLQRLVKKDPEVTEENRAARPYLSEAWDACGGRKGKRQITPEIKWRAPAINEVELKDHLKHWAHAVASTIR